MKNITLREWIENFDAGKYDSKEIKIQIEAGWYDWFCRDSSLRNKIYALAPKVKQIANSQKVDIDNTYVFFKNNCPGYGTLYDDFRICDIRTSNVLYTVVPSSGHKDNKGQAELWGRENEFLRPLVVGKWKDIKNYFGV